MAKAKGSIIKNIAVKMAPTVKLNNGMNCPRLGLGTWLSGPGELEEAVKTSINAGYRLFDCAWIYGNEKEVGVGLRAKLEDKTVTREELFISTKLWNTFHEKEKVVPACQQSLKNFGLDYVDLFLVHWPVAQKDTGIVNANLPFQDAINIEYDIVDTWKAMEGCVKLGLAKSIGLSNFNSNQIQRILDAAEIKPVINQIEVNPNMNQKKLINFCLERGIQIMAYSPLGSPTRPWAKPGDPVLSFKDPKLTSIGEKYGKNSSQVILRYLLQIGVIPIPKSVNNDRIKQNIDVFDFELSPEDMAVVDSFNCNGRAVAAEELKDSSEYPFKGVEF